MSIIAIDLLDPSLTRKTNPGGTDVLHLKDPVSGRDHWVFVQDLFAPAPYETWSPDSPSFPYDDGDRVTWNFRLWESLINGNEAVPSEGASWHEVSEPGPTPVTQEYVDTQIASKLNGIAWKQPVKARTTGALPAYTVSGGNMILTANANGAFPNQDDTAIALNDDILVMNEAAQAANGIYRLTQAGSAGTPWILTRRDDANIGTELQNAVTSVNEGTSHANTSWRQNTDNVVIGTNNIVWVAFGSSGISNSAANNELMKSNGTNAVASGLFSPATGTLLVGPSSNISLSTLTPVVYSAKTGGAMHAIGTYDASALGSLVSLIKSRGSSIGAHVIVQNGDALGGLNFYGSDGANFIEAALIAAVVDGTPGTTDMPAMLQFHTTPDGAAGPSFRAVIRANGNFGVGSTALSPTRLFEVGGSVAIKAGASTGQAARVGGTIRTDTTTTGNILTGDDTLQSYSVPADCLSTNGDTLFGTCSGTFAATANNKTLRIKFGATTIFDSGALAIAAATDWVLQWEIIRTGAATQKCSARLITSSATQLAYADYSTAGETLSGAVTLLITGEATATNDIVKEMFKLRWEPAE